MKNRQSRPQPDTEIEAPQDAAVGRKPRKKYSIDIFRGWCKCCGICASFCPRECIRMNEEGSPVVEDSDRCTGCGWCELHCPDFAISVRADNSEDAVEDED